MDLQLSKHLIGKTSLILINRAISNNGGGLGNENNRAQQDKILKMGSKNISAIFRVFVKPYHQAFICAILLIWLKSAFTLFGQASKILYGQRIVDASETNEPHSPDPRASDPTIAFLTPDLNKLIRSWEESAISAEDAKSAVWEIVRGKSFLEHKPSHGIVFVKTHKTASSTVTSMLHSLATSHDLIAPLTTKTTPFDPRNAGGQEELFHLPTTVPEAQSAPYDVWSNHVKFHESLLSEAVPSSGGKYVSIVRDPASRLRSACKYYECCPATTDTSWALFIIQKGKDKDWSKGHCAFDQTSRDIFGPTLDEATRAAVETRVDRGDLFLMVSERMVESSLALWNFYDLHPLDVAFISQKVTIDRFTGESTLMNGSEEKKPRVVEVAEEKVREWNPYDTSLHELANHALSKRMKAIFPEKTIRERAVRELELLNDIIWQVCLPELKEKTPELNDWCREKKMDNVAWNECHLDMMNFQRLNQAAIRGRRQRL
mmetsp:Transcript_21872/g.46184  ORF Transcript_21872/g.46184 Transcript_21872/m.46184 type:complete len:489 (-) Transcript_21872:95-1561(-)